MSAGTVVIAGGILATVILLTIVGVLCLCRLQCRLQQRGSPARNSSPSARSRRKQKDTGTRSYYCCKREESEKGEEEEPELATMSPSRPLALSAPPTPPTPEHYGIEPENYPPTFLTEANGPASYSPTPPPRRCQRSHAFCPSCARCSMPFYLQHPERLCNGGRRISYRTVQQQDLELPVDLASFYHKLNLIRSVTMKEVVTHSISTDV